MPRPIPQHYIDVIVKLYKKFPRSTDYMITALAREELKDKTLHRQTVSSYKPK